jgi:hypothetical protein
MNRKIVFVLIAMCFMSQVVVAQQRSISKEQAIKLIKQKLRSSGYSNEKIEELEIDPKFTFDDIRKPKMPANLVEKEYWGISNNSEKEVDEKDNKNNKDGYWVTQCIPKHCRELKPWDCGYEKPFLQVDIRTGEVIGPDQIY